MIGAVAVDAEVPTATSGWRASSTRWSPVVSHTSTVVATVAPGAVATRPAVEAAWHAIVAITRAAPKLFSASSILIGGDYVANQSGPQTRIAERAQLRQHTDVELRDGRCYTPTLKHSLQRHRGGRAMKSSTPTVSPILARSGPTIRTIYSSARCAAGSRSAGRVSRRPVVFRWKRSASAQSRWLRTGS